MCNDSKWEARQSFRHTPGRLFVTADPEHLEMVRKNWTVFFVFLSVLSRRVMLLWAAVFVYRIRRRVFGCQVPGEAALR